MIILGCEMGVPPLKETPIKFHPFPQKNWEPPENDPPKTSAPPTNKTSTFFTLDGKGLRSRNSDQRSGVNFESPKWYTLYLEDHPSS